MQQLASLIQGHGGILGEQSMRGRKPLLAPIKGQKEGYLAILEFTLNAEHVAELESACKANSHILRSLLAQQERKKESKAQAVPALAQATGEKIRPEEKLQINETPIEPKKEEKIDLQGIDEKLEEIFKETP